MAVILAFVIVPLSAVFADKLVPAEKAKPVPLADTPLADQQGHKRSLSSYKGKVVWVDFWASWCGPCRQSFPWMNQVQRHYRQQGLEVVAINLDEDPQLAYQFLQHVPAQFTVLLDSQARLPEAFGVIGMPSSYLIDRQGRIRAEHIGFHSRRIDDYENSIKQLLAE